MKLKFYHPGQFNNDAKVGRDLVEDIFKNYWEKSIKSEIRHRVVEAVAAEFQTKSQCGGCAYLDHDAWFPPLPNHSLVERDREIHQALAAIRIATGPPPKPSFQPSMDMLFLNVEAGCVTCLILLAGIFWVVPDINNRLSRDLTIRQSQKGDGPFHLSISGSPEVEFYSYPTLFRGHSPWPIIGKGNRISGVPGSVESIACMRKWVMRCSRKHKKCPNFPRLSRLPTRVLKVRFKKNDWPEVRLVETGSKKYAQYACLSHRWGNTSFIQTTRQNIERWKAGIPWSELPRTFQDALMVTLSLATDYLWIDSLCIVQDDRLDWKREAARMHDIYALSFVTIAATTSENGNEGLFPAKTHPEMKLSGRDPRSGEKFQIYVRPKVQHFFECKFGIGADFQTGTAASVEKFPLLTRGWVFQERLISPRVIHFTERELLFECREEFRCECSGVVELPNVVGGQLTDLSLSVPPKIQHQIALESKDSSTVGGRWRRMMEEYASLNLTKPSDLLPALEGLRTQMQPLRGRYIFGLWEDDLCTDLCWKPNRKDTTCSPEWRAPTWSWASVDTTSLSYPGAKLRNLARIVGVSGSRQAHKSGQEETTITLRGRSSSSRLQLNRYGLLDICYPFQERDRKNPVNFSRGFNFQRSENLSVPYRNAVSEGGTVHCLEILAELQFGSPAEIRNGTPESYKYYFLVLQDGKQEGLYERIGLVECEEGQFLAWFEETCQQMSFTIL
jgi:hypothetical protein